MPDDNAATGSSALRAAAILAACIIAALFVIMPFFQHGFTFHRPVFADLCHHSLHR